ncbi:MAG: helix-turn-helix transcriptional regulator, partial [Actinomycetes bacterium]
MLTGEGQPAAVQQRAPDGTAGAADSSVVELTEALKAHRKAAGLTQIELAAKIGYTRQHVSGAERAYSGLPSADLVAAIDNAVSADGALIDAHARARVAQRQARHVPGSQRPQLHAGVGYDAEFPQDAAHLLSWDSISDREREALLARVGIFAGPSAMSRAEPVGAPLWSRVQVALDQAEDGLVKIVERLQTGVSGHWKLYESSPSHRLIGDVLGQLETATAFLARPHTPDVLHRLRTVVGEIACQAAWLCFDLGATSASRQYYAVATRAAQDADNPELQAQILGRSSFIDLLDRPTEALHTLRTTRPLVTPANSSGVSAGTRSWLAAIEAEAHAI